MTADVRIVRTTTGDQGTFGRVRFGEYEYYTGELPWRNNARGLSCIPVGTYRAVWVYSNHFKKWKYLLLNVLGRSGVLIHAAGYMGDTKLGYKTHLQGCIAMSERVGIMEGQKALLVSMPVITKLELLFNKAPITVEITDVGNSGNPI